MRRSLRKRIIRASRGLRRYDNVDIVVLFAPDAFADAPMWSPGKDFVPAIDHYSWYRREADGLVTAVVAGIHSGPPADGQETTPEIWTVVLDTKDEGGEILFSELWDKPHRIRWLLGCAEGGYGRSRIVSRTPLTKHHYSNGVNAYWEVFERKHGFVPRWAYWKGVMARPWVIFRWGSYRLHAQEDLNRILDAVAILASRWPIEVRVYPEQHIGLNGNDYSWSIVPRRSR